MQETYLPDPVEHNQGDDTYHHAEWVHREEEDAGGDCTKHVGVGGEHLHVDSLVSVVCLFLVENSALICLQKLPKPPHFIEPYIHAYITIEINKVRDDEVSD